MDENGNVIYSERKLPDKKAEEVEFLGVPAVTPEDARRRLEAVTDKPDTPREDRESRQTAATESAERLKANRETARQNLRAPEAAARVKEDSGEFLDDAQRRARIEQTRKDVKSSCGG